MATHDYVIDNQSGAAFRTDLNNALAAIVSNNSNSSSPSTTYAYQFWADTSTSTLKIRNSSNNAWIALMQLDGTLTMEDGTASLPALTFRDDLDTGIFSSGANELNITTGGTERIRFDGNGRLLVGTTTAYGRIHSDDISFNPADQNWLLGASFVSSGAFGGGYVLLDGSAGYSMYCGESGSDFFIQHHSSTTAGASGGVKIDNAATSWTSASDERDKENLVEITDATTKVKSLRTVIGNYTWKPDVKHAFFIAQDVQSVLPEAVSVLDKSAETEDQRLGIRYTEVMPLLTAALKEAIAKIETLETKVAALEAA